MFANILLFITFFSLSSGLNCYSCNHGSPLLMGREVDDMLFGHDPDCEVITSNTRVVACPDDKPHCKTVMIRVRNETDLYGTVRACTEVKTDYKNGKVCTNSESKEAKYNTCSCNTDKCNNENEETHLELTGAVCYSCSHAAKELVGQSISLGPGLDILLRNDPSCETVSAHTQTDHCPVNTKCFTMEMGTGDFFAIFRGCGKPKSDKICVEKLGAKFCFCDGSKCNGKAEAMGRHAHNLDESTKANSIDIICPSVLILLGALLLQSLLKIQVF